MKETSVKRFEIYRYNFGNNPGSIQSGFRPVLVIQDDRMNKNSPTNIVAAITTATKKTYLPSHVIIGPEYGLDNPSMVMMEQLRVVNQTELTRYVGSVTDERVQRRLANAAKKAHEKMLAALENKEEEQPEEVVAPAEPPKPAEPTIEEKQLALLEAINENLTKLNNKESE